MTKVPSPKSDNPVNPVILSRKESEILNWKGLRIHFVAIGGIGMSALARIAAAKGSVVSGCDGADSPTLADLRQRGIACHLGHSPAHVNGKSAIRNPQSEIRDLVVYSSAVPRDAPELQAAEASGIPVISRGQLLAALQHGHETVAIAGAHGKTTTTWIIANMLIRCGADPTVAVGGNIRQLGGNARTGSGPLFVTEADESDGSFLLLAPKYPVITNIDRDHLEHWTGGIEQLKAAFTEFARHAHDGSEAASPSDGAVIACTDCLNVRDILPDVKARVITCATHAPADVVAGNIRLQPTRSIYDARLPGRVIKDVILSLPGLHNVWNSLAALALAHELGLEMDDVLEAFADTGSVDRRLQRRGCAGGVTLYDDYAHHPEEIRATLAAARHLAAKRLIGLFQPHRYSRTLHLHREFGPVFNQLDLLVIAPIYAASEPPIDGVTSELIAREVAAQGTVPCETLADLQTAPDRLAVELRPGDVLITLGAGDIWKAGDAALQLIRSRPLQYSECEVRNAKESAIRHSPLAVGLSPASCVSVNSEGTTP